MRIPALLTSTTEERVRLPSGREVHLPKATPRFPKWEGEFPWSTYGNKPLLDLHGDPLYAEIVILRLLEAEGWSGVWVNSVRRGPYPRRWTPSPIMILPPSNLLDLLDRIYARIGKRSGAFDVLAWAGESVLFAEAKRGGKDALRPSQKAWIEAALDEGVPLGSLLVVEWRFGGAVERAVEGHRAAGAVSGLAVPGTGMGMPSQPDETPSTPAVDRTRSDARSLGANVTINEGVASTSTRRVKLSLRADDPSLGSDVVEMRIRNGGGEPWTEWRKYATRVDWKLSVGEGEKAVYVQFKDRARNRAESAKATITLRSRVGGGGRSGEGDIQSTRRADKTPPPETRVPDSGESSRLASEGVDRPARGAPEVFLDAHDPDAHGRFLRWRERNRGGYVISRRSASDAMLHRTYCGHFEHGDKSVSLTRTMQVCSQSKAGLEAWARENVGGKLKRCRDCM